MQLQCLIKIRNEIWMVRFDPQVQLVDDVPQIFLVDS